MPSSAVFNISMFRRDRDCSLHIGSWDLALHYLLITRTEDIHLISLQCFSNGHESECLHGWVYLECRNVCPCKCRTFREQPQKFTVLLTELPASTVFKPETNTLDSKWWLQLVIVLLDSSKCHQLRNKCCSSVLTIAVLVGLYQQRISVFHNVFLNWNL